MEVLEGVAATREGPAAAPVRTRRNPFTGRVSYVDPSSARGLRTRVPRPILAMASALSLAAGIALAAGGGSHESSVDAVSGDVPVLAPVLASAEDLGPPSGAERR